MAELRRKSLNRRAVIALSFAILLIFGAGVLLVLPDSGDDGLAKFLQQAEQSDVLADAEPAAPHHRPGPKTGDAAIAAFLDSEQADNWRASFELLSIEDRQRYLSAELWAARRDGVLGSVERWRWIENGAGPAVTELVLTPAVSLTNGVTPPGATIEWTVVDEDGWRIALAQSVITPRLPSDELASASIVDWLGSGCSTRTETPNFLDSHPMLADEVCSIGLAAVSETSAPGPPKSRAAGELGIMFGPSAAAVVRAIPLTEPSDTVIIVAPIQDGWIVIDVLPEL